MYVCFIHTLLKGYESNFCAVSCDWIENEYVKHGAKSCAGVELASPGKVLYITSLKDLCSLLDLK